MTSEVVLLVKTSYYHDTVEWIEWYKKLGFNHITIYDNESTIDFNTIIANYSDYATYNKIVGFPDQLNLELQHYRQCKYDYVFFADADEFLWIDPKYKNINEYLDTKCQNNDIHQLAIYWVKISANPCPEERKDKPESTQVKSFKYVQEIESESWIKCFYKTGLDFVSMHCHFALPYDKMYDTNGNRIVLQDIRKHNYNYNIDDAVLYHYFHKSWEEFKSKMQSTYAPVNTTYTDLYPECQFKSYYNYARLLYRIGYSKYDNKVEKILYG